MLPQIMIAFDFVGQLSGRSRWAIAREAEEVTPFRSSYLLARFIDCSSSSRLFLEVENNCVKKERVVNTNGKTHLLLTRCLALLFCTVKILLSKSNETDELTYQKSLSKMHVQCGRRMMVQFELLDEIGQLIYLPPVANTESMRNKNNLLPRHFWPRTRLF